jgi:hypothetical protein
VKDSRTLQLYNYKPEISSLRMNDPHDKQSYCMFPRPNYSDNNDDNTYVTLANCDPNNTTVNTELFLKIDLKDSQK